MTGQPATAIRVRGLRKSYGKQVVLDGIDFEVEEGTVLALLGPNGAGKTTIVNILATLLGADGGEASVFGHDLAGEPSAIRSLIGVTGQVSAVDGQFTGEENLRLMADLCLSIVTRVPGGSRRCYSVLTSSRRRPSRR